MSTQKDHLTEMIVLIKHNKVFCCVITRDIVVKRTVIYSSVIIPYPVTFTSNNLCVICFDKEDTKGSLFHSLSVCLYATHSLTDILEGNTYVHSNSLIDIDFDSDVDECEDPDSCNKRGACQNYMGGFNCTCDPEWEGPTCSSGESKRSIISPVSSHRRHLTPAIEQEF